MADYTNSKRPPGDMFPSGGEETTFERTESLISPTQLRNRHLFGIPLISGMKDPRTGKAQIMEDPLLADKIDEACAIVEAETGLIVFPTKFQEKLPFDLNLYKSFGFLKLRHRPVSSVEGLFVTPSNEVDILEIPVEWLEVANLREGQLNIVPLTLALTRNANGTGVVAGPASAVFLTIFGHSHWLPAFWRVSYTAGFDNGKVPKIVNELVGVVAAMEILSMLAPTFGKNNSSSLSIDGMSQSISTPGPEVFNLRMTELAEKRAMLTKKMKASYGTSWIVGEV